jgi:hypothetical protein
MNEAINNFQQWFDHAEIALSHEANQAGLLQQSSLVGSAREFLIHRVLRSILPPVVHIGSGRVIDMKRNASRQIDIVIYDPRFPILEIQSGIGMYPIEGVIATVEVKSTLTAKSLDEALENTSSLLQLTPGLEDGSPWMSLAKTYHKSNGLSKDAAMLKAGFEFMPATYIYAFNSKMGGNALANSVDRWFKSKGNPAMADGYCAVLPRIIVAGHSLGLLSDGLINLDPGDDVIAKWIKNGNPRPKHMMSFWDNTRRFGWFMTHAIHTVCSRLGLSHALSGAKYGVDQYLSIDEYYQNDLKGKNGQHCLW